MDKRGWLWKRKSSDKQIVEKASASTADSSVNATQNDKGKQDNNDRKPKYIQISMDSYTHLTGLEDRVKSYEERVLTLEDEVKELNEKLSEAHSEMTDKENLVKQHAKVAEDAISGWEKAEAEAETLKNDVESVTLLKLSAEDRASHLDGALKQCMRQIRILKEEHDQKLHEVVLNKTKLFDKMKHELEAQIGNLEQELLRSAAENAALSRSLQERSNMLINLCQEKSQAEAEIERLRSNIESCEKEINSLKYELHIASKEVEIRNEEKNMSVRSAEAANRQHLEGVKKIVKLEAECQRLRGLVRKKLPGPAALAQMKLEVENMGRDYGDYRVRRSSVKPNTTDFSQFSLDNSPRYQKENELLSERLLAMDEEMRMLKEVLTKRNSELQSSRSICVETASKLQSLEAQLQANSEQKSPLITDVQVLIEGCSSRKASIPPSPTSRLEDGSDDNVSCAGSWVTSSMSEQSYIQKELKKSEKTKKMDLMDDFLEMEKLTCLSHVSNGTVSSNMGITGSEPVKDEASLEITIGTDPQNHHGLGQQTCQKDNATFANPQLQVQAGHLVFVKLQSRISTILESITKEKDLEKVVVEVRHAMQDMLDTLHPQLVNSVKAGHCSATINDLQILTDDADITSTKGKSLSEELETAISHIYNFVMNLNKESKVLQGASSDGDGVSKNLKLFSAKYAEAINGEINLVYFVLDTSHVLREATPLVFNVLQSRSPEVETSGSDCIDKIVLPENKGLANSPGERYHISCSHFSNSASDPDIPSDGNLVPTSESSRKSLLEEFENLKMDKDNLALNLARCTENFESTKSQLQETEQLLADVKSQLTSAQKSNSLAETQLKCMAESYKSLETRAEELQTEVNLLQGKIENLDNQLQEEKRSHQDALSRCNDLLKHQQRIDSLVPADNDEKTNQELADAAEKLAVCQETIFLLGKQFNALRPQTDMLVSPNISSQKTEVSKICREPTISGMNSGDVDHPCEMDPFNAPFSPSDSEANNNQLISPVRSKHYPKHRPTKSGSPSASSTPTPEKQNRGLSRFFSSKGKN